MNYDKEEIYKEYHDKVLRYVLSKVNDFHLAEDLVSDVFVKVYEKLDTFNDKKASFSTWIYTITRNRLIDYYRTRKVMSEIPENLTYEQEEESFSEEDLSTLAKALEDLDCRSKKIVVAHYYSGKSLKEIADDLDISYAYVKILHKKALVNLKKYFKNV